MQILTLILKIKSYNSLKIYKNALIDLNFAYKLIPFDNFENYMNTIYFTIRECFLWIKKYTSVSTFLDNKIKQ